MDKIKPTNQTVYYIRHKELDYNRIVDDCVSLEELNNNYNTEFSSWQLDIDNIGNSHDSIIIELKTEPFFMRCSL